jgi:membrane-associated phospholipid phosphatase
MMVLVFTVTFALGRPSRALYYIIMMMVNCYFTVIMKLVLHRPRPFMVVDSEIKVVGFSSEFGDPSGHTMSCAQVLTTLFLDLNSNFKGRKSYLFIASMSVILTFVGYSRMFNGVHTLDQVIYGALIGLWIAFFGHECVRANLFQHVD